MYDLKFLIIINVSWYILYIYHVNYMVVARRGGKLRLSKCH